MANEIAVSYLTGKTLTVDIRQSNGDTRQLNISLTETPASSGLYLGSCATIEANDYMILKEGGVVIGGEMYDTLQSVVDDIATAVGKIDPVAIEENWR